MNIDKALRAAGIRHNADREEFERDGQPVEIAEVERALLDLTLDEIASFADSQADAHQQRARG
jgi:hypothetical protein